MKKTLLCLVLLCSTFCLSQEKLGRPFFNGTINIVLGINENYELFQPDDDEYLLDFTGVFTRIGFGYEFKRFIALSFNTGYDYHWNYAISAVPAFANLKVNLWEKEEDAFFVDMSYGKMYRFSKNYADGNYYGFGVGMQVAGERRWNTVLRLDFQRKAIFGFKNNRLDNISFGIGFSFF